MDKMTEEYLRLIRNRAKFFVIIPDDEDCPILKEMMGFLYEENKK